MNMMVSERKRACDVLKDITFRPALKVSMEAGRRFLEASDAEREMISTAAMQIAYRDAAIAWLMRKLSCGDVSPRPLPTLNGSASKVQDAPVTSDVALEEEDEQKQKITADDIFSAVSEVTGYGRKDIIGRNRSYAITPARKAVCLLMHVLREDLSLPVIGRILKRDHSTVLHAIRQAVRSDEVLRIAREAAGILNADDEIKEGISRVQRRHVSD